MVHHGDIAITTTAEKQLTNTIYLIDILLQRDDEVSFDFP